MLGVSWSTANASGSSSDHITWHEAALSLALATAALALTVLPLRRSRADS